MGQHLNILVQSSEYYAPFAGVMLTSLFENNKDMDQITVYLMTSDMSGKNRGRFQTLAEQYQRIIKFIDTKEIDCFLEENQVPKYHGAYVPYYKIFALSVIEDEIDRLIYLDSDMVINGSISELMTYNLGKNVIGMCVDYAPAIDIYQKRIGVETYSNTGMIVFDVANWKKGEYTDKIIHHIRYIHANYPVVDQDLINVILNKQIQTLPAIYNFNPYFYIYKNYDLIKYVYGINICRSEEEMNHLRENAVVLHCFGGMLLRPWDAGNEHPIKSIWERYMSKSLWSDYVPVQTKKGLVYATQEFLYKNFSNRMYAVMLRKASVLSHYHRLKQAGL